MEDRAGLVRSGQVTKKGNLEVGPAWTGLDWTGLDWTGLDWIWIWIWIWRSWRDRCWALQRRTGREKATDTYGICVHTHLFDTPIALLTYYHPRTGRLKSDLLWSDSCILLLLCGVIFS